MTSRSYLALLVVTVLALAGAAWTILAERDAAAVPGPATEAMFPAINAADAQVNAVDVQPASYSLRFERSGDGWVAAGSRGGYPARPELVNKLVADIAGLRPLEAKTDNPDWYPLIGVEDMAGPTAGSKLVKITGAADATLAEVLVGKPSTSLGADLVGGTFVRVPGEERSWLASGLVSIPATVGDWFQGIIDIPGTDIKRITISEGDTMVFDAAKQDGALNYSLTFIDPARQVEGAEIDDSQVKQLGGGIVSVLLEDVRPAADVPVEPNARKVRFETVSGMAIEVVIARSEGRPWVMYHAEAAAGTPGAALADAINSRTDGWAFRLASSKTLALLIEVGDLMHTKPAADGPVEPGQMFLDPSQIPGIGPQAAPPL